MAKKTSLDEAEKPMTLVASFHVNNWPVLVGDIMVSTSEQGRQLRPFNIPTYADGNVPVDVEKLR